MVVVVAFWKVFWLVFFLSVKWETRPSAESEDEGGAVEDGKEGVTQTSEEGGAGRFLSITCEVGETSQQGFSSHIPLHKGRSE